MSYRKYDCNYVNNKGCCNNRHHCNLHCNCNCGCHCKCYYWRKPSTGCDGGHEHRGCQDDIRNTQELIDKIDRKNNKSIDDLENALDNFKEVDLPAIACDLNDIKNNLNKLIDCLDALAMNLDDVVDDLDKNAIPNQEKGVDNVLAALNKQEQIPHLIDDLNNYFDKTVACLKDKRGHNHDCKHKCDCGSDWDCD